MVENEHPGGFKPAAADRQPEPNSGEGAASLEGKCVCSVCGAILGEFAGQGTSHGLCQTCRQKVERGDPATLAEIKQSHREGREVTKIDQEIFKKLDEMIAIIENEALSLAEKLNQLAGYNSYIGAQISRTIKPETTQAELDDDYKRLVKMREVRERIMIGAEPYAKIIEDLQGFMAGLKTTMDSEQEKS